MATPVHFDLPFRFNMLSHSDVVEQDAAEDVANCIAAAVLTNPGDREDSPTFGVPSQLFDLQPLHIEAVLSAVSHFEQRAELEASQSIDPNEIFKTRQSIVAALLSNG